MLYEVITTKQFLEDSKVMISDAVRAAQLTSVKKIAVPHSPPQPKLTADAVLPPPSRSQVSIETTESVVAVGASTGGTEALRVFLERLPIDCPGVVRNNFV